MGVAKRNTMSEKTYTRYVNKGYKVECQHCLAPILVGGEYVSRIKHPSKQMPAIYCLKCAGELLII